MVLVVALDASPYKRRRRSENYSLDAKKMLPLLRTHKKAEQGIEALTAGKEEADD